MNKKYKAAVIGVGFIGAGSHVPAYQTDERCELVAVADLKPGAAEYVAKRYGVEKFYEDPQQMLEECKPDVVSIRNGALRRWRREPMSYVKNRSA